MNTHKIPIELLDRIGEVQNLTFPQQGHTSLVLKLKTRDHQYIIKKTEHPLYNEWLAEEYQALQYLSTTKLPVPRVHAFHIQGQTRWLLMDYIDGLSLRHYLLSQPSPRDRASVIADYGACLRQIHETPCPAGLRNQAHPWLDAMLLKASHNLANYKVDGTEELLMRLEAVEPEPHENTFIHGDFHTNNVIVNNNKVVGIIDWPRAAYGDPRFDLALAVRPKAQVFDQKGDKPLFFESYGRREITEEEYLYYQEGLYKFF